MPLVIITKTSMQKLVYMLFLNYKAISNLPPHCEKLPYATGLIPLLLRCKCWGAWGAEVVTWTRWLVWGGAGLKAGVLCLELILIFVTAVAHLGLSIFCVLFPHPLFLVPTLGDLWPGDKPRWPWKAKAEEMALYLRSYLPMHTLELSPSASTPSGRACSLIDYTLLDACSVLSAGNTGWRRHDLCLGGVHGLLVKAAHQTTKWKRSIQQLRHFGSIEESTYLGWRG